MKAFACALVVLGFLASATILQIMQKFDVGLAFIDIIGMLFGMLALLDEVLTKKRDNPQK